MKNVILIILVSVLFATSAVAADKSLFDCSRAHHDGTACMACNIYHEARGESLLGKLAVGIVTVNRSLSGVYPADMCAVVWQNKNVKRTVWVKGQQQTIWKNERQYSWTKYSSERLQVHDAEQWRIARLVSYEVMFARNDPILLRIITSLAGVTRDTMWYHTKAVNPKWDNELHCVKIIGNHQFYDRGANPYWVDPFAKKASFLHPVKRDIHWLFNRGRFPASVAQ